jgi:HD-GYP domain-containing protein (c-di-GMP phosphodiesterase class II)
MSESQVVRGKIAALRDKLEPKPAGSGSASSEPAQRPQPAAAGGAPFSNPQGTPKQLTPRAHRVLEQSRELLQRLRALTEQKGQARGDSAEPPNRNYAETLALLEVMLRVVQTFPEAPSAQLRLCDGLEAMLSLTTERVEQLAETAAEQRLERDLEARLEKLLSAVAGRQAVDFAAFQAVATSLLAEVEDGRPLRFTTQSTERPEKFAAWHGLATARVAARLVRLDPATRGAPVEPIVAALLHDVGMISVAREAWLRPDPLQVEQRRAVEGHCRTGAQLLTHHFASATWLIEAAAGHHERLDGTGYPAGLKGENLTPLTRFIAVCDVYAAMASARLHRPAYDPRTALTDTLLLAERGELDRHQAERLLQLSFYPAGSVVELADGAVAIVVAAHSGRLDLSTPARPVVTLLTDAQGQPLVKPRPLDLAVAEQRKIVRTLPAGERRALLGKRFPDLA